MVEPTYECEICGQRTWGGEQHCCACVQKYIAALEKDSRMQVGEIKSSKMHTVAINETITILEKKLAEADKAGKALSQVALDMEKERDEAIGKIVESERKEQVHYEQFVVFQAQRDEARATVASLRAVVQAARRVQCPKEPDSSCLEMEIYCALQIELDALDRAGEEKHEQS